MKHLVNILMMVMILLLAPYSYAGTYWVSSTGAASWSNCSGTTPLSGTTACSLSTANQNAVAGDTIYLREGSYSITGDAIAPSNSGTSKDNMITFSGYNNEVVTIYGVNNSNGKNSRGINLYGKSYIKVTSLIFTNLANYLYITNGSHHNEISYCTFKDIRDVWNVDVIKTGKHTGPTGSSTVLVDSALGGGTNTYAYRRIENVTDGSSSYMSNASDATTVTHSSYPLSGGKKNYWTTGDEYKITSSINWAGSYIFEGNVPKAAVSHNWIHHNIFKNYGAYSTHDEGVALELGVGNSAAQMNNDYNTIENNHMYAAGHHVLGVNASRYNVIRNNYIHNEGWYSRGKCSEEENGVCGYRVVSATVPSTTFGGRSLWEGNRIGHGAAYGGPHLGIDGASGSGTTLATPSNIYRYNDHFNNALYGLRLGASISAAGNGNRVYNNTFYHNGYGADDDANALDTYRGAISLYNNTCAGISGSVIKNNLMYDHWVEQNRRTLTTLHAPVIDAVSAENLTCNTITNNYGTGTTYLMSSSSYSSVDPLFTDSDVTTPLSEKPDLSLQPGSSAINAGTYLTLANGPGSSSTKLVVNDAGYFQDGTWGSDLARATLSADWIAIGTIDNVVQIQSIDYSTNTITLQTPITWNNGVPVWLYRKSDGAQVLLGSAPDMGAHEYGNDVNSYFENPQSPAPTIPTTPTVPVPPTIAVSPATKDFGTLPINTSSPAQKFTVTTTGGSLNVDGISMTGTDANQFTIQNDSCTGKIIAPEIGSCTFDVKFSPSSVGAKTADVAIVDNDSNTSKLIAVNGTGTSQIPAISFSPTALSFSNVLSGTLSSPQTIRVSNTSTNFVTISSISLSGIYANQFSIPAATDYCTGETVAASGNCTFQIVFSPTSGGEKTANVNLTALYYGSPATLPLYGSAVVYPAPKIKISRKK